MALAESRRPAAGTKQVDHGRHSRLIGERRQAAATASKRYADIKTTIEAGNPEIQILFDQERAAALGLAVRDIADRVVANVRGELATR